MVPRVHLRLSDSVGGQGQVNRRPSAFQVNRAERCADLRKRTSPTSETALGGRCNFHASRVRYAPSIRQDSDPTQLRPWAKGLRPRTKPNQSRMPSAPLPPRSLPSGPSAVPDERGGQDHPVASRRGRRRRGRGRCRCVAGAALRARSAPAPQAARRTAPAGPQDYPLWCGQRRTRAGNRLGPATSSHRTTRSQVSRH
jgi:hypothetical protein